MTRQIPDRLRYCGRKIALEDHLLEKYFKLFPERRPEAKSICSALWRGYFAQFEVREGELWLEEMNAWGMSQEEAGFDLEEIFPEGRKMSWFSGLIRTDDLGGEFMAEREEMWFEFLEFTEGKLRRVWQMNYEELMRFKQVQFELFSLTPEYETVLAFWKERNPDKTEAELIPYIRHGILYYTTEVYVDEKDLKMETERILVLCTGNSCRSQMMHGYLRSFLQGQASIYSAGVETHGVNPNAVAVMAEVGIDLSTHKSTHVDAYQHLRFGWVITVCDHAKEVCPVLPGAGKTIHHSFPDPAKAKGTEAEVLNEFRKVRDLIGKWAADFATNFPR